MADIKKIRLSGQTYNIVDETAIHSLDGYWTSAQTQNAITAATDALADAIAEQGYQTATDVQNAISGKADSSAVTEEISAAVSVKADTSAVTEAITEAVSGKVDTTAFTAYTSATDTALASKFAGAVWSSNDKKIYFYDNASNTGTALAYIDGTDFVKDGFLSSVTIDNRTIEGESVPCLVFVWNTDSGIQETDIPLSGIFDPSNYVDYTAFNAYTAATQTAIGNKADQSALEAHTANTDVHITAAERTTWNSKQDALTAGTGIDITSNVISVTGVPLTVDDNVTSDSSNPVKSSGIYNFVTSQTSAKQDTLVSGTNIKTVGTNSLLGSGNIALMTASIGTGNDSETLIFDFA